MKLYHATELDRKDQIIETGLQAGSTSAATYGDKFVGSGVWFFGSLEAAREFGTLNYTDYAIFCAEIDEAELIADREYEDGESYICPRDVSEISLVEVCE